MDASTLPPCSRVLAEKVKRVNYICNIWCNATLANPPNLLPENCGWVLEDNAFRIKWFEGDMSPTDVEVICQDQEDGMPFRMMKMMDRMMMKNSPPTTNTPLPLPQLFSNHVYSDRNYRACVSRWPHLDDSRWLTTTIDPLFSIVS